MSSINTKINDDQSLLETANVTSAEISGSEDTLENNLKGVKVKSQKQKSNCCVNLMRQTSVIYLEKSLYLDGRLRIVPTWAILSSYLMIVLLILYTTSLFAQLNAIISLSMFT